MIVKNQFLGKTLVITLSILSIPVWGRVHEYETARLKSTGGAGIGSVLLNESVLLNPAPLAVFNQSAVTYQRDNIELKEKNVGRAGAPNPFDKKTNNNALIWAEGTNKVKGAVGYFSQVEGSDKRKQVSTSVAGKFTDTTSIGTNYRFTKDTSMSENNGNRFDYHSFGLGMMHFYSNSLSVGLVANDLAKSKAKQTSGGIGFQYAILDMLNFMADMGSNYQKSISHFLYYKVGAQFRVVGEFYVRAGYFSDKMNREKGMGMGGGWVGPKLDLEFGMKTFTATSDPSFSLLNGEKQKEMALSLSFLY